MSINDMGAAINGKFISDGSAGYSLMVGNGRGDKFENDKFREKCTENSMVSPMKNGVVELLSNSRTARMRSGNSPVKLWSATR